MDMKLEKATLKNVAEGHLEIQFQERLQELHAQLASADQFELSNGRFSAKIGLELAFEIDAETGSMVVGVRSAFKGPKRKLVTRGIYRRNGKFFIADEWKQTPLFNRREETTPPAADAAGDEEGSDS